MPALLRGLTILAVLFLSGCGFGVGVMFPQDMPAIENPAISGNNPQSQETAMLLNRERGMTTCSNVLARWGEPDSLIVESDDQTVLVYKYDVVWTGVVAMIGLPFKIPIGIPVGQKSATLICKNDVIAQLTFRRTHGKGLGCFWWGKWICGATDKATPL